MRSLLIVKRGGTHINHCGLKGYMVTRPSWCNPIKNEVLVTKPWLKPVRQATCNPYRRANGFHRRSLHLGTARSHFMRV